MKTTSTEIKIPAAIAELPLTIAEQITLARIDEHPGCTNDNLARSVGMTTRGLKKLLQRLHKGGFIAATGKGRARQLFLKFHVEQGTDFPVTEIITPAPNRELRAPPKDTSDLKVELSLADDFNQTMRAVDEMTRRRKFFPETVVRLLEALIRRVELEMEAVPDKARLLHDLYTRRNAFFAVSITNKAPKELHRQFDRKIANATPEQLTAFRERCQAAQMEHKSPLLLAARFLDEPASEVIDLVG